MPTNEAAWAVPSQPLQVREAPYLQPGPGEILVRTRAVAINPVDWMLPFMSSFAFPWIKYPFVLGIDLAGEVVSVGEGVIEAKPGDRVLAMGTGTIKSRNRSSESAFQAYAITLPRMTTPIPDVMPYEAAAVLPLGVATAACGLFQKDALALEFPTAVRTPRDQWVIVWGGSTSVGCNAIQLATAAGYEVVTTCSPKNFDYVRSLGAAKAFDYNSPTVMADITAALQGKDVVGALTIGAGSVQPCMEILSQCRGRKFVANVSAPISMDKLFKGAKPTFGEMATMMATMLGANVSTWLKSRQTGVTTKFYDSSSVVDNEVGPRIFRDFLPQALASGAYRAAPPPKVVGSGLGDIQTGFDIQRKGVSATKIVVTIG